MKKFYAIILGFTAIMLAVTAAYFSVFGLSKLFIGAALSIIIMAGTLEFSKILVVSFLHQYWEKIAKGLRSYLLLGTIVLMIITSTGIYGFLSSAYSRVSIDLEKMTGNVTLIEKKIEIKSEEKSRLNEQVNTKNNRVVSLTELRKSQEARLDSLYQRGWGSAAKKTETIISQADDNIAKLNIEINEINAKIENLSDSISKYETVKLELGGSDIASEVGPLKYIAKLTGASMDTVVNWLTLLLIIVFDPLAVALIIATSSMIKMIKDEKEENIIKDKDDAFRKKVKYISDEQGNFKLEDEIIPIVEKPKVEVPSIDESIVEKSDVETLTTEECVIEEQSDTETLIPEEPAIEEHPAVDESSVVKEPVWQEGAAFEEPIMQKVEKESPIAALKVIKESESFSVGNWKKQSLYLRLLEIFYKDGEGKVGEKIPTYLEFKTTVDNRLKNVNEKDIKDFLVICNLFKITEFKDNVGFFEKEYNEAFELVSKI